MSTTKPTRNLMYVGKLFKLKNYRNIPWYPIRGNNYGSFARSQYGGYRELNREKDFGDSTVLIIDENTKRVRITTLEGVHVWISKHYLGAEIPTHENIDTQTALENIKSSIAELYKLNLDLQGYEGIEKQIKSIQNVLMKLRVVESVIEKS